MTRSSIRRFVLLLAGVSLCVVACGGDSTPSLAPPLRAVRVITEPCGDASGVDASGVLVISNRVVTAAHVVVGSAAIRVFGGDGSEFDAAVEVLDRDRDVAVLRVEGLDAPAVRFTRFAVDDDVALVGGAATGDAELVVTKVARIEIDTVRSTSRSVRDGYELVGESADGDSGAGLYDIDGRLGALLFAESSERSDVAFAVASSEIDRALDAPTVAHRCDPAESQLIEVGDDVRAVSDS